MKTMTSDAPADFGMFMREKASKSRIREEEREARYLEAVEAAERRNLRTRARNDIQTRVEDAMKKLSGRNAADTIAIIDQVSIRDRDVYLIAEEFGQARKSVQRQFNKPRRDVRDEYVRAAGLEVPNEPSEADEADSEAKE